MPKYNDAVEKIVKDLLSRAVRHPTPEELPVLLKIAAQAAWDLSWQACEMFHTEVTDGDDT